jgi:hypothetical protein
VDDKFRVTGFLNVFAIGDCSTISPVKVQCVSVGRRKRQRPALTSAPLLPPTPPPASQPRLSLTLNPLVSTPLSRQLMAATEDQANHMVNNASKMLDGFADRLTSYAPDFKGGLKVRAE